jgi:hypothetical protein
MADAPRPHDDPAATAPPPEPLLSPPVTTSSIPAAPAALEIPPPPSLSPPQALQRALDRARARLRPIVLAEGAIAVVAAVAAAMLAAALVLTLAPFSQALRSVLLLVVVLAAGAAVAHVWFWRGRMLNKDLWLGARLQDALARRGVHTPDAVAGAIELRDQALDTRLGRSRALCDAHIHRTVAMLDEHRAHQSLPAVGLEQALPTLLGAAGVFAVLVVALAFAHEALAKRWLQLLSPEAAAVAVAERAALEPPLVTDLTLTLRYPAYMARADEVIAGASGDVTAPRGTEVIVEGRADIDVSAAAIVLTGGPEELSLQAQVDGRQVRGRFTVAAPGAWRFKLTSEGRERLDPAARQILVKADAAPTVRLEHPIADETVQPDDEIKVVYGADDDFGITSVRLVVRRQGSGREPFVQVLAKDLASVKQSAGGGVVAIKDVGARPGEKLALVVEVLDNDTISGPNIGRSATRVLTVFSAAAHHREVIERLHQLLGQMVEVLGDELESPVPPVADAAGQRATLERQLQMMPRAQQMLTFFDETLAAVAKDTELDDDEDSGVRRALANMRLQLAQRVAAKHESVERTPRPSDRALPLGMWRRVLDAQQALVVRLENDILYLEDLLQRERLREAQKLVQDLRAAQQDLKTLLQQYKDSGDASAREALLEEIKRMQQQLAELAARLGELRSEVPDEFFNEEAFQSEEMMQDASSLDELIEEGRLEDAATALQKMLDSTEKMMQGLDDASDEVGGQEGKALREQMERFSQDLSSLEAAQKDALQETEALMEKARKKAEERLGQKAQAALKEAARLAERAKAALDAVDARQAGLTPYEEEDLEASSSRTSELQSALESGDITDAQRAVEEAESAARSAEASLQERLRRNPSFQPAGAKAADAKLQEAIEALRDAREKLETASPDPTEMLDAKDKERLQRSAERQAQLQEQAQQLAEQMAEMQKAAPLFGQKHQQQLDAAQQAMGQASQQLKSQGQPRSERGGLRRARQSQSQALQQLQGLKDAMEQMGKESGGGGGMPMPLPHGGSPGSERSEGQRGKSNRDDVKIPDGSDFKVKDAFRKDILDAMREGAPGEWAGEVKRYYEELIK